MSESDHGLTRRQFLGLTGGLIISFTIPARFATAADDAEAAAEDINAWLRIGPDSKVTVFAGKVEIGQGLRTSFAQMAAEELTVPVANVEVVLADTDLTPFDEGTWGSLSVRTVGRQIMAAAAKAREILTQMAAEKWGVSADKVTVSDGRASLVGNASTSVALGELTQGRRITRQLQGEPKLRPPDTHEAIGASVKRVEGPAVVTGQEQFVGDVRLPGMLYGAVLYPPSFGAKLTSVDASRAEKAPGVVALVQEAGIVGIVADRPDIAQDARSLIRATWSEAANPSMDVLWDSFRRTAKLEDTVVEDGKVEPALASAARTFTATYRTAFLAHAPMEPHIAVGSVENGKALVYSSTQTPFPHRDEVAKALGIDKKNVHVIAPRVGGGFGGRESADCAVAAALMSRQSGPAGDGGSDALGRTDLELLQACRAHRRPLRSRWRRPDRRLGLRRLQLRRPRRRATVWLHQSPRAHIRLRFAARPGRLAGAGRLGDYLRHRDAHGRDGRRTRARPG